MACSTRQRAHIDQRVEFTCITNSNQKTYKGRVVNIHAAIRLAFALGTRFGIAHPNQAGEYMAQWLEDARIESSAKELGLRHQRAMMNIVYPLMEFTPEEYEHTDLGDNDDEEG